MNGEPRLDRLLRTVLSHRDSLRNPYMEPEDVEHLAGSMFPVADMTWMNSHHDTGRILELTFPDDAAYSISIIHRDNRLVAVSVLLITERGEQAVTLGVHVVSIIREILEKNPVIAFSGDSGSYSWTLPGFIVETAVFGTSSSFPHGVQTVIECLTSLQCLTDRPHNHADEGKQ